MKPPIPRNEPERIQALHELGILDSPPEPAFDDITHLAAFICETPFAQVTLIDTDRQWVKSAVGLKIGETTREDAFCAHAITEPDRILEVPDALRDQRFATNPYVTSDPNIRFYAGAPLVTDGGYALGTLCVLDRVPRALTPIQRRALLALQRRVTTELNLRLAHAALAESTRTVQARNAELARINAEMNRMLGMAAHDLRNPIAVISMYSGLLLQERDRMPEEDRRGFLEVIASVSQSMLSIVNDFLDLSKIESGNIQLRWEDIDLVDLTTRTAALNRALAAPKGIAVECQTDGKLVRANVDRSKMEQVLTNLLTNAVKFSESGSSVQIMLTSDGPEFRWEVRDEGRGMSEEQIAHLFKPFSPAQRTGTSGEKGSGLGLAIARKIVEAHEGRIEVASRQGHGSTFTVVIPRERNSHK